ncbi:hypothetical protein E4O00_04030 [Treponema sp. OMZ 788]|uniref:hypothetical protein n=1 Tax=Treponema sp. OMZ 788 TaxID=2563664 RepID=UPI0020A594A3|nr:hypothetical protein [Treponema sp. OMZ 788]UTC65310.1 hypothetical protein E4O00_04030 [Treponema sp. OMZ 788]
MSRHDEYAYELERQKKQEIFNERLRKTTAGFYENYMRMYEQFLGAGFQKFIPAEMSRLQNDLKEIKLNQQNNPVAARDISFQVQSYIYTMNRLGESAKNRFLLAEQMKHEAEEEAERIRLEKEAKERDERQAAIVSEFFKRMQGLTNPAIRNFAEEALSKIKKDVTNGVFTDLKQMTNVFDEALHSAEKKLSEWKAAQAKAFKEDALRQQIETVKAKVEAENLEDSEKKSVMLKRLDDLFGKSADKNISQEDIQKDLIEIQNEVEETAISEEVRRFAVKSIIRQLSSQGFEVDRNIQLIKNDNGDFVKITASMPSGKRVVCNITDDGRLNYKFDNYEGMTCLKDIQKFNVDLEKIYSIKLSDEKILWSNPDRIGKEADKMPVSSGRVGGY